MTAQAAQDNRGDVAGECRGKSRRVTRQRWSQHQPRRRWRRRPIWARWRGRSTQCLTSGWSVARPRAVSVVGSKLRIEVNLSVFGVRVTAQAFTAARVARERSAPRVGGGLPTGKAGHPDTVFVEGVIRLPSRTASTCPAMSMNAFPARDQRQNGGDGVGLSARCSWHLETSTVTSMADT